MLKIAASNARYVTPNWTTARLQARCRGPDRRSIAQRLSRCNAYTTNHPHYVSQLRNPSITLYETQLNECW